MKINSTQRFAPKSAFQKDPLPKDRPPEKSEPFKEIMTWSVASAGVGAVALGAWTTSMFLEVGVPVDPMGVLAIAAVGAGVAAAAGAIGGVGSVALDHFYPQGN